jgi:hypothetical protein
VVTHRSTGCATPCKLVCSGGQWYPMASAAQADVSCTWHHAAPRSTVHTKHHTRSAWGPVPMRHDAHSRCGVCCMPWGAMRVWYTMPCWPRQVATRASLYCHSTHSIPHASGVCTQRTNGITTVTRRQTRAGMLGTAAPAWLGPPLLFHQRAFVGSDLHVWW